MQKITKNQRARLYQGKFTTHIVADFHGYEKIPIRLLAASFSEVRTLGIEGPHLRPYKKLLVASLHRWPRLNKALGFANDLFNALESAGYRLLIFSPAENFTRPRIDDHEQLPKVQRSEHTSA